MPPFDSDILTPSEWFQAGAIGVLALTVILITILFLWYIIQRDKKLAVRDKMWQVFLKRTYSSFVEFLEIERERRAEAMDHGLRDVNELSTAVGRLADAMGSHDNNAQARHAQIAKSIGEIKGMIPGSTESAMRRILEEEKKRQS